MRRRQLAAQRSLIKLLGRTILEPNTGEVRKVVRLKSDFPKLRITAGKEKLLSAEHFLVSFRCRDNKADSFPLVHSFSLPMERTGLLSPALMPIFLLPANGPALTSGIPVAFFCCAPTVRPLRPE